VTYGAETWTVTYGAETWTVTCGAETWTVTCGAETWTVTYGAETCTLTSKMEKMLMVWERMLLRKIYGPTKVNGQWRTKTNDELMTK
jgi:hypothetical protein